MITLYGFGPYFGLPDASPYVMKTEVQLRMAGLAYRKDFTGFPRAPKGKLPYIEDGGVLIPDSTFIRAHIERRYGHDFDAGLDAAARAQAWATERMIEDHLAWAQAYMRWVIPENFEKGPARFFDGAPPGVREDALARVKAALHGHGMGRHSLEEITTLGGRSLDALATLLGDKPFLMGDRPCGVDATAMAMLATILVPLFDSPLRRRAEAFPDLVAYKERMMQRFYPDHALPAAA